MPTTVLHALRRYFLTNMPDIPYNEAQGFNRHQRRRMGKINNVRITGTVKPIIKPKKKHD